MALFKRKSKTQLETDRLATEVDSIRQKLDDLVARVDIADQRIVSVANEVTNQLSELSGEIDSLGMSGAAERLDALRDSQTRLANEQARYQIAFLEDLAELVEELKRD